MRTILDKYRPLYEANGNAGGATEGGQSDGNANAGQSDQGAANGNENKASFAVETVFSELDADSRKWMVDQGYATPEGVTPETASKAYKQLREQERLLGSAIRVPGKDATQEQRDAFLTKLGRPEKPDGYVFEAPKDLPEGLPYDGERANEYKGVAHKLGLTAEQAKGLHDWFMGKGAEDYRGADAQRQEKQTETGKAETGKLEKVWGPLDGETFQTNLELAHRFITGAGDDDVMPELQRAGLISEDGMILSAPVAKLFAKAGATLYKEGDVLRGHSTTLDNPFEDGKANNMTEQMNLIKTNRPYALSLIAAAGKKPGDFGLKD